MNRPQHRDKTQQVQHLSALRDSIAENERSIQSHKGLIADLANRLDRSGAREQERNTGDQSNEQANAQ